MPGQSLPIFWALEAGNKDFSGVEGLAAQQVEVAGWRGRHGHGHIVLRAHLQESLDAR